MKVTIFGPNLSRAGQDKGSMHVHATGCGHAQHYGPFKRFGGDDNGWAIEAETVKDVVLDIYCDIMSDRYTVEEYDEHWEEYNDLYIAPCARKLR